MKRTARLAAIFAGVIFPGYLCIADDGSVSGDTRYKYSQRDNVSEKPARRIKAVQTLNTRTPLRVVPRWRRVGVHWYYARAGELPWWPNAPGD